LGWGRLGCGSEGRKTFFFEKKKQKTFTFWLRFMTRRVLISGAGVAGPVLAFWLCRYGLEVTLVERAPGLRPGGYAVDFRGSGMRVLEMMGLVDEVRAHETRTGTIAIVNAANKVVATLPSGFTSGELEISRTHLVEVLYEATRGDVEYIFGDSVQSIDQRADGAHVTFASGKAGSYDIVVGADGLHSNVRALAFGEESQFVRRMGYYIAIFTVPDFLDIGDEGRFFVKLGKRVGYFGRGSEGLATASFYFSSASRDYDRGDVASQKRLLRQTFAGMAWQTPRLLEMLDGAPDFYFDSLSQVKMAQWSAGRVVLLGDAAACASPMAGMGTSIAMIGAYVLAGELKMAGDDHAAAFASYQAQMRDFVTEAQKMADSIGWFMPTTRLKLWLSQRLWSWMPPSSLRELMIEQPTRVAGMVALKSYL